MDNVIIKGKYDVNAMAGHFYHYTSIEGFKGILQTRTLYFTDCRYLNDFNERLNINNALDKFWRINNKNYDENFKKLIGEIRIDNTADTGFNYMDRSGKCELYRYFVFSASLNKDSLFMRKNYTKNEKSTGYSIGLATYALCDEWLCRNTGVAVEEGTVAYNSEVKQTIILQVVEKLYDVWCMYKRSEEIDKKIYNEFYSWSTFVFLFFKKECFSTEVDYRFVAIVPSDKVNLLEYHYNGCNYKMYDERNLNGLSIPFIKMPFNDYNKEICWPIYEIFRCDF